MTEFWKSDTYLIVKAMKATGNQPGVVAQWKVEMELWASTAVGPDADAVKTWLPLWQVRPFYTATELAPIFPMLSIAFGYTHRPVPQKSANRLANELKFAGLPYIMVGGTEYFVVEQIHRWSKCTPTPEELKEYFHALG